MGYIVTEVVAGVTNLAVADDEESGLERDEGTGYGADGYPDSGADDSEVDHTHDFASPLSRQGTTVFNYSQRARMEGDGGNVSEIGYTIFNPVAPQDLDGSKKREEEANEYLRLTLAQYEAQRLAEMQARLAELEKEIKELTLKVQAFDVAFDLGDDADLNDNTLNGLAKRNKFRQALIDAGIDPNQYFREDGTVDQEKWAHDRLQRWNDERERLAEQLRQDYIKADRLRQEIRARQEQNASVAEARAGGDSAAAAEYQRIASTAEGAQSLSDGLIGSANSLTQSEKVDALMALSPQEGAGPIDSEVATNVASLDSDADVNALLAGIDGVTVSAPDTTTQVAAEAPLPETVHQFLQPAIDLLPEGTKLLPIPDANFIDLIRQTEQLEQQLTGSRNNGSFAAELGMEDLSGGIKPISASFASAASGESVPVQVASAEATYTTEEDRTLAINTGTSGSGGMSAKV